MKLTKENVLHLDLEHYTPKIVKLMRSYKFKTHIHIPNNNHLSYLKQIKKLGIDQVTFDNISILKKL